MAEVRIALYRMNDNPNTCGKFMGTSQTTFVARVRGVFRGPFNVIAPTLELVRGISDSNDSSYEYDWYTEVNNFNYACIENAATVNPTVATKPAPSSAKDCPRYYFVQNVTVDPMGRIIVALLEDVLETYKTSIKELNCFVERSSAHWNPAIPDPLATPLPKTIDTQYTATIDSMIHHWRPVEEVWNDTSTENSRLCYIIKISCAICYNKWGNGADDVSALNRYAPQTYIVCTRGFLNHFLKLMAELSHDIVEYFTRSRDNILSIATIPEWIDWNDDYFRSVRAGTASQALHNSEVIGRIKINSIQLDWPIDDGSVNVLYGFVLKPGFYTMNTDFKFDLTSEFTSQRRWQDSSTASSLSLKFNPFGTFDIPNDALLGDGKLYLRVQHSLVTGQAQLLYSVNERPSPSVDRNCWRALGETMFDFELPFLNNGNWGGLITTAVTLGLNIKNLYNAGAGKSLMDTSGEAPILTRSMTLEWDPQECPDTACVAWDADNNAYGFYSNDMKGVRNIQRSYSYQSNSQAASTKAQAATAKSLGIGNVTSGIASLVAEVPHPTLQGSLRGIMIDKLPTLIQTNRAYLLPDYDSVGGPEMIQRRIDDYAGFVKCGNLNLSTFRSTLSSNTEPIPYGDELTMIVEALTTGFYNKKSS